MSRCSDKIVAIIECRMTSSRLPGKVLMEACGKPLLELLIERVHRVKEIHEIVVATTQKASDEPIAALTKRLGIKCFRGSEHDVLDRVYRAAKSAKASIVVEITGDCPLLDPSVAGQVIQSYIKNDCDYASNLDPVCFPVGMDTQVFSMSNLETAHRQGKTREDREHVSWFIRRQPQRFNKLHLPATYELHRPDLGLTLDEHEDYLLIRHLFEHFYPRKQNFSCYDIIHYLEEHPDVLQMNENVDRPEPEGFESFQC